MKKFLSMFMSIVMLLSITAGMNITANAKVFSGYCGAEGDGSNLTYNLDTDSGVLTISGTGKMYNYSSRPEVPWYSYSSSVKTVEIEYGVTSIGRRTFYDSDSLISITIPNSVTSIGDEAFCFCNNLTSITIPNSVTSIGNSAFYNCSSLTSIKIPNSVTSIGGSAFEGCGSLTSITIPNSVTSIGDSAFYLCSSLTSITIPNSVTSIGDSAFRGCSSLTSITIPDSVTSIGNSAFYYCSSLTSITVDGNNQNYSSQDGILFNKDKTALIQYPIGNIRTSYTIPNSVTKIGDAAFSNCVSLTSITIGNSVTSIGDFAFFACSRLISITIPNSVTSIGYSAFNNCRSLTSITIPNSVTSIGNSAFWNCKSLTSITIPNSVTSIGDSAFYSCNSLTSITILNLNCEIIDEYDTITDTATIYGYENSTAQAYAEKYSRSFVSLDVEQNYSFISNDFDCGSMTYGGEYGYKYSDSYFNKSATIYNHHLATMSLCLASSAFNSHINDEDYIGKDDYSNADENVYKLLEECGFKNYSQFNYHKKPTENSIACAIASKPIDDSILIAVAVRGGGYEDEWSSNYTVGASGNHQGFDESAFNVLNYINDYIFSNNISGNVKFWITGYSRGAAVSNILAAQLFYNQHNITNVSYTNEDVYAYCFATPAGVSITKDPHSSVFNNIFSIINYHDPVPLLAPAEWDMDRYGITKVLPFCESLSNANYYEKRMIDYLEGNNAVGDGFCDYEIDDFKNAKGNNESLGTFLRSIVKKSTNITGSRAYYAKNYQEKVKDILVTKDYSNNSTDSKIVDLLLFGIPQVINALFTYNINLEVALNNLDILAIAHNKNNAYYLAWMQSMDSNYVDGALPCFSNGDYRVVKVNCPVDVYVYDSSDNLVASIINEVPQDIDGSSIISSIDENEQKLVYLPIDSDYRVEVVAREDCQTTYTVNEYSGINADISKVVSYSEVDMQENDSMISEIDAYSLDEIDSQEGATDGSTAEYTLELNNNLLSPNVKATGEDVENYTYNVQVSYDENQGEILGGGQFTAGDFCLLTATNKAGYMFEGWYVDNSKVSSEYSYRFAVKGDCTVEARFVTCTHQSYTENVVPPTYEQQGYTEYTCTVCGYTYTGNYVDKLVTPTPGPSTGGGGSIGGGGGGFVPPTPEEPATTEPTTQPSTKPTVPTTTTAQSSIKKPKSTSIKKLTKGKKSFKITFKKVTGISGYEVQCSTDKKFKKNKKSVIVKKSKTSTIVKKLKSKKTYYVRVRTYKIVNGKKVYSSWSKVKAVKTK